MQDNVEIQLSSFKAKKAKTKIKSKKTKGRKSNKQKKMFSKTLIARSSSSSSIRSSRSLFPSSRRRILQNTQTLLGQQQKHQKKSTAATATAACDEVDKASLKPKSEIPGPKTWPILESMPIFMKYFEKEFGATRIDDFFLDMHNEYGDIVQVGDMTICYDEEFLNILQKEGKYPRGILEGSWTIKTFNEENGIEVKNPFLYDGETWRKGRMEVNPHLFNLQTARKYLPSINKASSLAAGNVMNYANDMNNFTQDATFDMLIGVATGMGGEHMSATAGNPESREFSNLAIEALGKVGAVGQRSPWTKIKFVRPFSGAWKDFTNSWMKFRERSTQLVDKSLEIEDENQWGFVQRFVHKSENVSKEQCYEMLLILFVAGLDTTTSALSNFIYQLAHNQDVQLRLQKELDENLGGKDYNAETKLPYLEQCLKESQRTNATLPWVVVKSNIPEDTQLGEYLVPKGSIVVFNTSKMRTSEEYAGPNPLEFNPDRWSKENIEARKGTKAEFLDHPIVKEPFGFGARRCVGSRVAKLEIRSLLSRLFQDYHFEIDHENSKPGMRLCKTTTQIEPSPQYKITKRQM